ncbi:hypothetical protein ACFSR7_29360 [Cohnella sp. GCM10020058]|uniref:hypothetical protein n=1 Tax=Cohnella sp. GCM10020058 TaxID=3317330 RepID=UPI003639E79C
MVELEANYQQNRSIKRRGKIRYALVGLLTGFAFVFLGVYYGYASDERLPSFHLEKIAGNDSIGESIRLVGSYNGRKGSRGMTVDVQGTTYPRYYNTFGRLFYFSFFKYYDAETSSLIKNYRNYMRGKAQGSVYQTDGLLVYTQLFWNEERAQLRLSILNKESKKVTDYKLDAGEWEPKIYITMADQQVEGERIHVLLERVSASRSSAQNFPKFTDYIMSLRTGELLEAREIKLPVSSDYRLSSYTDRGSRAESRHSAFMAVKEAGSQSSSLNNDQSPQASSTPPPDILDRKAFSYNYENGEVSLLILHEPDNGDESNYFVDGDTLYIVRTVKTTSVWGGEGFDITGINLASGARTSAYTILASDLKGDELMEPRMRNGIFYFLMPGARATGSIGRVYTKVAAVEASSGKTLYEGQVVYDGPEGESDAELRQTVLINMELGS